MQRRGDKEATAGPKDPFARDWRYPDSVVGDVTPGWPTLNRLAEYPRDLIEIGHIQFPRLFQLDVVETAVDARGITLYFLINPDTQETELPFVGSRGVDVDAGLEWLRRLRPMSWWIAKARLHLAVQAFEAVEGRDAESITRDEIGPLSRFGTTVEATVFSTSGRPRRRNRISRTLLSEVAAAYRAALVAGNPPTQAVAHRFRVSHSTAARYVGLARKAELLGPANGSRGGELRRPEA